MKISIVDLMDYYYDDPNIQLDVPENRVHPVKQGKKPVRRRSNRPLKIAAALLLAAAVGAFALWLNLQRTEIPGNALTQPAETFGRSEPVPSETMMPQTSAEEGETTEETPAETRAASAFLGLFREQDGSVTELRGCYGNMTLFHGDYYTFTEEGMEEIEPKSLHTTIDLYGGTWALDLDYAVVHNVWAKKTDEFYEADGILSFNDLNDPLVRYAEIDGEIVTQQAYYEAHPDADARTDGIVWDIDPVALVSPVEGSTDTVLLRIPRSGYEQRYQVFYNLETGEITDPFEDFEDPGDHGAVMSIQFSPRCHWAFVYYTNGDLRMYDLRGGAWFDYRERIQEAMAVEVADHVTFVPGTTLTFISENVVVSGGSLMPDDEEVGDDRETWIYGYDLAGQALLYHVDEAGMSLMEWDTTTDTFLRGYDTGNGDLEDPLYLIGETGEAFKKTVDQPVRFDERCGDQAIYCLKDNRIYLMDFVNSGWAELVPDQMPAGEITDLSFLAPGYFCISTETGDYVYHVMEDPELSPLEQRLPANS